MSKQADKFFRDFLGQGNRESTQLHSSKLSIKSKLEAQTHRHFVKPTMYLFTSSESVYTDNTLPLQHYYVHMWPRFLKARTKKQNKKQVFPFIPSPPHHPPHQLEARSVFLEIRQYFGTSVTKGKQTNNNKDHL